MRIKLTFTSVHFKTEEELNVCEEYFTVEWSYPVLPRIGEILWFPKIVLKDIPTILWEDYEMMIDMVFWESDEKGLHPVLSIKCS